MKKQSTLFSRQAAARRQPGRRVEAAAGPTGGRSGPNGRDGLTRGSSESGEPQPIAPRCQRSPAEPKRRRQLPGAEGLLSTLSLMRRLETMAHGAERVSSGGMDGEKSLRCVARHRAAGFPDRSRSASIGSRAPPPPSPPSVVRLGQNLRTMNANATTGPSTLESSQNVKYLISATSVERPAKGEFRLRVLAVMLAMTRDRWPCPRCRPSMDLFRFCQIPTGFDLTRVAGGKWARAALCSLFDTVALRPATVQHLLRAGGSS